MLADDASTVPLRRASAGTKALLRPDGEGWQLRLHTSYPFGADYVYAPGHAVPGWGDPAHPAAWAQLWNRTDCPPTDSPDAIHDVALALSDDAGGGRRLEHSGYGWWAVAPVGMFPERIVATQAGLAYGDPATAPPQAPATYRGRVAGHLFWDQQRFALAGDLTLTLESAGGTARLAGRIDSVVVVPLDHESLEPRPGPPTPWPSLMLEAGEPHRTAWSGAAAVGDPPLDPNWQRRAPETASTAANSPDRPPLDPNWQRRAPEAASTAANSPDAFGGDWHAKAHGPDGAEIAGRLRLWTPLTEGADPNTDWPAQAVLVAGFAATMR